MSEESTDPSNSSGESSGADSFSQLLAGLRERADRRIAELMAQDPATIDLAGHIDWMPRVVIEALVPMKDQLNDESRAALEQWQERERQRARELWEQFERAEQAFRRQLPPNWNSPEIGFPSLEQLETLQFKEGLPLAWLPPNRVLSALLLRRTSGSRRRLPAEFAWRTSQARPERANSAADYRCSSGSLPPVGRPSSRFLVKLEMSSCSAA